jgi:phage-related protein
MTAGGRTLADAYVRIRPDGKTLGPELKQQGEVAGRDTGSRFGHAFKTAVKAASLAVAVGAAFVGVKTIQYLKEATKGASDLNETVSKAANIFPKSTAELEKFASTSATAFGLSRQQALEGAAGFGNFFNQIGIGEKKSLKMSEALIQLSADLGSFDNADPAQVMASFQSATRGEYDSLQQFIPTVNAAAIQTEALRVTHKKSVKDLTDADKALALYNVSMRDAGKASGDFARTSGGLANQQRIAAAGFKDLKDRIGTALLPVVQTLATVVTALLIPALNSLWSKHGPQVVALMNHLVDGLEAFIAAINTGEAEGEGFAGFMSQLAVNLKNAGPFLRGLVADVKAYFASQGGGKGGDLSVNLKSAADSAKELLPVVKEFVAQMPDLASVVSVANVALGFLADHTEELKNLMPLLVAAVIAYKGAQVAAHLAALAAVPTKIAEVIINRQLIASNRALIASRAQLTVTTEVATVATAANTGVEQVGLLTRARVVIAMIAQRVAMVAVRAATLAWTAVQWLLNAALLANPIGLIIVGIALLVAGIIYAYKHSEVFRKIVQGAWKGIQIAAKFVVDWFVNTAWPFLKKAWDGIVTAVKYAAALWTGYMNLIRTIVSTVFNWIAGFIRDRINTIIGVVKTVVAVYQWFRDAFQRAKDAVVQKTNDAIAFVRSIPGRIRSALGNLASTLYNAGRDLVQGMINGIGDMIGRLVDKARSMVSSIPGAVKNLLGISSPSKVFAEIGKQTVEGFIVGLDRADSVDAAISRAIGPRYTPEAPAPGQDVTAVGGDGGMTRLHPADLRQLAELLGEVMYRAIGLSGSGDARSSQLFVRGA